MPSILILISIVWQQTYHKCHCLYKVWCICSISTKGKRRMSRGVSLASTVIHEYGYYDTRTRLVNMRVSKISVPAGSRYPFLISVFYPLRVLSVDTCEYRFFWYPYLHLTCGPPLCFLLPFYNLYFIFCHFLHIYWGRKYTRKLHVAIWIKDCDTAVQDVSLAGAIVVLIFKGANWRPYKITSHILGPSYHDRE